MNSKNITDGTKVKISVDTDEFLFSFNSHVSLFTGTFCYLVLQ